MASDQIQTIHTLTEANADRAHRIDEVERGVVGAERLAAIAEDPTQACDQDVEIIAERLIRLRVWAVDAIGELRRRATYLRSGAASGRPIAVNEECAAELEVAADALERRLEER